LQKQLAEIKKQLGGLKNGNWKRNTSTNAR
jgi:hypothetical protein